MKRPSYFIVSSLILLALLGLGSMLFKDPVGTIKWFLLIAAMAAIMFFVIQKITGSSAAQSNNQKAYRKAAKQSQKNQQLRSSAAKPKDSNVVTYSFNHSKRKPKHRKKSDVQLTVIDGKKGKKKNRA